MFQAIKNWLCDSKHINEVSKIKDDFRAAYPAGSTIKYLGESWTITKPVAIWIPDGIGWVAWLEVERINLSNQHEQMTIKNFSLVERI